MGKRKKHQKSLQKDFNRASIKTVEDNNKENCMADFTQESLDALIAALGEATKALTPTDPTTSDTFTQKELESVLAEVTKLSDAITAMVTPVTPPVDPIE